MEEDIGAAVLALRRLLGVHLVVVETRHPGEAAVIGRGEAQFGAGEIDRRVAGGQHDAVDRQAGVVEHPRVGRIEVTGLRGERVAVTEVVVHDQLQVLHARRPARIVVQAGIDSRGDDVLRKVGLEVFALRDQVLVDRQIDASRPGVNTLLRGAVALGGHVLVFEQRVEGLVGRESELAARAELVFAAGILPEGVVQISATLGPDHGEAAGDRVGDRARKGSFIFAHLAITGAHTDLALDLFTGFGADHIDSAGAGVAAEEGRLRATKHLDPLEVEERHGQQTQRAGYRDAIEIKTYRALKPLGRAAEAAQAHRVGRALVLDVEVRCLAAEFGDGLDALLQKALARLHRHRYRYVAHRLDALLGGYGDFLDSALGKCQLGKSEDQRRKQ